MTNFHNQTTVLDLAAHREGENAPDLPKLERNIIHTGQLIRARHNGHLVLAKVLKVHKHTVTAEIFHDIYVSHKKGSTKQFIQVSLTSVLLYP